MAPFDEQEFFTVMKTSISIFSLPVLLAWVPLNQSLIVLVGRPGSRWEGQGDRCRKERRTNRRMFHQIPGGHWMKVIAGSGDCVLNKQTASRNHPGRGEIMEEMEKNYSLALFSHWSKFHPMGPYLPHIYRLHVGVYTLKNRQMKPFTVILEGLRDLIVIMHGLNPPCLT